MPPYAHLWGEIIAIARNAICLWYGRDAEEAARLYAAVDFTIAGIPRMGLNGGPAFKHSEAFSFQIATEDQEETDRTWSAMVGNGGRASAGGRSQGQMRKQLADHAASPDGGYGSRRRGGQARGRGDDATGQD